MNEYISDEYINLLKIYEGFNGQFLIIKGWSASIGIAALIAAYTKPISSSGRIGVLVAAFVAVPFWLTESMWKVFQNVYIERINEIEDCALGNTAYCTPFQTFRVWSERFDNNPAADWFWVAIYPHVLFPHAALLVFGLALWWFWPPKPALR